MEDLCLTFSVSNADYGQAKEVDLIEDGRNVSVTGENKIRYIAVYLQMQLPDPAMLPNFGTAEDTP